MRRALLIFTAALMCFTLLSGCDQLEGVVGGVVGGVQDAIGGVIDSTLTDEQLYSKLSYLIASPENTSTDLPGSFTFTAMLLDEAEEITFSDEDGSGLYHMACIARNAEDSFFLEVGDIAETYHSGDIVRITGEENGFVYWTEDNSQINVLDIKATAIEPYTPPEITLNDTGTVKIDGNDIEFLGAHRTEDTFGDAIVVYFNFKNNGTDDAAPSLRKFYVEYADEELSSTIFGVDQVDPGALSATGPGSVQKTYAGKTQLYYIPYSAKTEGTDDTIYLILYNDDFQMTDAVGLVVFDTLEELYEE